jgi:predicted NUDIX family NTP pyrophosphohydrolase
MKSQLPYKINGSENMNWRANNTESPTKQSISPRVGKKTIKESVGIACCRIRKKKVNSQMVQYENIPEILLIQKRYTYAYSDFTHGIYNVTTSGALEELKKLLQKTTMEEKLDILSLDFNKIWYRVWLDAPKTQNYFTAKSKFESTFLIDNGIRLKKLIAESNSVDLIWEIPKGRKRKNESDINAAVREFEEETGLKKSTYCIFPLANIKYNFTDANTTYHIKYHIAELLDDVTIGIDFSQKEQIKEISKIRWMSIEEIRYNDCKGKRLEKIVKPIFAYLKSRI